MGNTVFCKRRAHLGTAPDREPSRARSGHGLETETEPLERSNALRVRDGSRSGVW
jgi:hypothetical protein